MKKIQITKEQRVACVLTGILPLLLMALGILLLFCGMLVNVCFAVTFVILPLIMAAGSVLVILSPKRKWKKVILCAVVLAVGLLAVYLLMSYGYFEIMASHEGEEAARYYEEDTSVFYPMPSLSEIGTPASLEFHDYYSQAWIFFTCDTDILIAAYSPEDYALQKARLEETYSFRDLPMTSCGYSCEPACQLDGYSFRVVALDEEQGFFYPKCMMLVATNDDAGEIVYLCFYDDDLDYIESLEVFLKEDCGWEHIR